MHSVPRVFDPGLSGCHPCRGELDVIVTSLPANPSLDGVKHSHGEIEIKQIRPGKGRTCAAGGVF
jgi:hypothetical protein